MFTSAREVLAKQTETDASSRGDDSTRARDANAPKPSFDVDAQDAKNIARAEAKARGYEGDMCGECSNFTLVRNGTCMKCNTCGGTSGCS